MKSCDHIFRSWPPSRCRFLAENAAVQKMDASPLATWAAHSGHPEHSCAGRARCMVWRKVSAPTSRRGTTPTSSTVCIADPLQPWLRVVGHERGPCPFTAVLGRQASSTTLSRWLQFQKAPWGRFRITLGPCRQRQSDELANVDVMNHAPKEL